MLYVKKAKKKRWTACLLLAAVLTAVFVPDTGFAQVRTEAAKCSENAGKEGCSDLRGLYGEVVCVGEDEWSQSMCRAFSVEKAAETSFDAEGDGLGRQMNEQMENYLAGSKTDNTAVVSELTDAEKAKFQNSEQGDMQSKVTFNMQAGDELIQVPSVRGRMMMWLYQAFSKYSSLCTLYSSTNYSYASKGGVNYLSKVSVYSPVSVGDMKATIREFQKELSLLKQIPESDDNMTDAEKLLYIHDELVAMAEYDTEFSTYRDWLPLGVLLDGKGVCQSYAIAFNLAASGLGVDSELVSSEDHAWNAVRIGGDWYYVDVTWDDPVGTAVSYVDHEYFLVTDKAFEESHDMTEPWRTYYGDILNQMGNAYDNYFPKKNNIRKQMCYLDGLWYYSNNTYLSTWDGTSSTSERFTQVAGDTNMRCDTFDGMLYYSGSRGLFKRGETEETLSSGSVKEMIIRRDRLCYVTGADTHEIVLQRENIPTPTPVSTEKPTKAPVSTEEPTPTPVSTEKPTKAPVSTEEPTPTPVSTEKPTKAPGAPTKEPAQTPSAPTVKPTKEPTKEPGGETTEAPSAPTAKPTTAPAGEVSESPTLLPDTSPTMVPGTVSTERPSAVSTVIPTAIPASKATPTMLPTSKPKPTASQEIYDDEEEEEEWDPITEPGRAKIKSLSNYKKKTVRCKLKKVSGASGYQIWYALDKKFKKKKVITVKSTTAVLRKLKKNKKYYIRVRAFCVDDGDKIYGKWSTVKKIKIKK